MNAKTLTEKYAQEVVAIRRWLHVHAETAWKEYETTDYIEVYLKKLGLEPHRFECGTGCWAMIYGEHPDKQKKTILLRADIDAMPGNDLKNVEYKSLHEGAVHSCGHDGNTAMTLVAAKVLVENKALLKGDVKLVFEPAEELSTGGQYCVSQGVLEGVDAAFAIHLWDNVDEGRINIKEGPCMAGYYGFAISVDGRSNTGNPNLGADAVQAMAKVLETLQMIRLNLVDPVNEPTVLTLGKLRGGYARNTVVDHVELEGVVRTFYRGGQPALKAYMERIAQGAAQLNGCTATVTMESGLHPLFHDHKGMNTLVAEASKKILGENGLQDEETSMAGDTFASYNAVVPGVYARLGTRKSFYPDGVQYMLHDDRYDFNDEAVLPNGTAIFVQVVMDYFENMSF